MERPGTTLDHQHHTMKTETWDKVGKWFDSVTRLWCFDMQPTVNFVTCTVLRHATLFVSGTTKYCFMICYLRTFCDTMKAFYGLAPMGTCEVTCTNRVCTGLGLPSMGCHPEVWGLNSANLAMWVWQVIDHNGLNVVKLCEKTLYKAYKLATEIYLSWDRYHVRNLYDVISTVLW